MGLSKPYSARSCSWRTGSIPRSPAIVSMGSPGMMRMRKNASRVSPMKVGITKLSRVSAKRYIGKVQGVGWAKRSVPTGGRGLVGTARKSAPLPTLQVDSNPPRPATSRLDVDPVEGVPAKRAELEVHHFLAHRL